MGYVYVIGNGRDAYKIGWTDGPVEKRLNMLQVGSPDELSIVHIEPHISPAVLERELHRRFAAKRIRGEWFQLDQDDLLKINRGNPESSTWLRLVELEPRLETLLRRAQTEWATEPAEYCAMRMWYGHPSPRDGLRDTVSDLVGWTAKHRGAHPELCTSLAYDIAYETVFDALPPCRGRCGCSE